MIGTNEASWHALRFWSFYSQAGSPGQSFACVLSGLSPTLPVLCALLQRIIFCRFLHQLALGMFNRGQCQGMNICAHPVHVLIWDFPASRTMRNVCLLWKPSGLGHFCYRNTNRLDREVLSVSSPQTLPPWPQFWWTPPRSGSRGPPSLCLQLLLLVFRVPHHPLLGFLAFVPSVKNSLYYFGSNDYIGFCFPDLILSNANPRYT